MLSKWYCTTRRDTPASAATSRMLAASSPRVAAMRHSASAISRRRGDGVPSAAAGSGSGTGGFLRPR